VCVLVGVRERVTNNTIAPVTSSRTVIQTSSRSGCSYS
jgi:hypothetical protein